MIDYKLKYQAVLFLNATDIQATPENFSGLMSEFADKVLIPTAYQELPIIPFLSPQFQFQPQALPQPMNLLRIRLNSPNGEWVLKFGAFRIDIEKNPIEENGNNLGELNNFCTEVTSMYEKILNKFPTRKANRIALVVRYFLKEFSEEQLQAIYNKLFNSPAIYREYKPFEWNWRSISRIPKKVGSLDEEFNFITQINRILGQVLVDNTGRQIDRIDLNLDINSSPTLIEFRYGISEIKQFFESVHKWHDELIKEFSEFFA